MIERSVYLGGIFGQLFLELFLLLLQQSVAGVL